MGRKSGVSVGGYHPKIFAMNQAIRRMEYLDMQADIEYRNKKLHYSFWKHAAILLHEYLVENVNNGSAWYEDSENVPEESTYKQVCRLVLKKLSKDDVSIEINCKLYKYIQIWIVNDDFIVFSDVTKDGKVSNFEFVFDSLEKAKKFIDDAPDKSWGWGVVIGLNETYVWSYS